MDKEMKQNIYDIITYARVLHEEKKDKLLEKSKEWTDLDKKISAVTTYMICSEKVWEKENE